MKKRIIALVLVAMMTVFSLASCGGSDNGESKGTIRLGSKAFTEAYLLSEIYANALEDNGYTVERIYDRATDVIAPAIENGEIDVYPEYIGTALTDILGMEMLTDKDEVYAAVSEAYAEKGITWLNLTACEDKVGIVMRADKAAELGIKTISDLQKNADKVILGDGVNFSVREDDLLRLNKFYGDFNFKDIVIMEWAQQYPSLDNGTVDVIPGLTTDPQLLETDKYTLLEEDIPVWPPQYVAPIVRTEVLEANEGMADILNNVSAKITTEAMIEMIARVNNGEEYEAVAKDFYEKNCK